MGVIKEMTIASMDLGTLREESAYVDSADIFINRNP